MNSFRFLACLGLICVICSCLSTFLGGSFLLANRQLVGDSHFSLSSSQKPSTPKILYIVTSVTEFDSGKRKTIEGRDRFIETLIPVVSESVESMLNFGYLVDTYMIAHYTLSQSRFDLLRKSLPASVGLEVWDDACPLGYPRPSEGSTDYVTNITRSLARQHRYVIKDKFVEYDGELDSCSDFLLRFDKLRLTCGLVFACFEDDMLLRGPHIQQFLRVASEIDRLQQVAPLRFDPPRVTTMQDALESFYGPMSKLQLARLIPGFIRVERVVNATAFQKRTRPGRIPAQDNYYDLATGQTIPIRVDPVPCCYRPKESSAESSDFFLWETHIKALGIRHIPQSTLGWVLLQRGGSSFKIETELVIGDYWAGKHSDFVHGSSNKSRPDSMESIYSNNQGGWMATKKQLWSWHTRQCIGGFLPPYSSPSIYPMDGMNHVVEYWSGGGNLFGRLACNLQRIIPLDPAQFSRHLLYHTSNNKQKQLKFVKGLFSQVNTFLGQLHTLRMQAEKAVKG